MASSDFVAAPRSAQRRASRLLPELFVFVVLLVGLPGSVLAMTVKDFLALPTRQQSVYAFDFIAKITGNLGRTNPKLMEEMRNWFVEVPPGKHFPEGTTKFDLELLTLQDLAEEGKADLSKIQVEAVIVDVIEGKFPPPNGTAADPPPDGAKP